MSIVWKLPARGIKAYIPSFCRPLADYNFAGGMTMTPLFYLMTMPSYGCSIGSKRGAGKIVFVFPIFRSGPYTSFQFT
jgi:hypothetical protein